MVTPAPYVYGQKNSYDYERLRKEKREAAEKERKEAEQKAKAAAAKKKLEQLMKKIKVSFTCGCFLCNGLRQFIAGDDKKELLADLESATHTESTCFLASVAKESKTLGCVRWPC